MRRVMEAGDLISRITLFGFFAGYFGGQTTLPARGADLVGGDLIEVSRENASVVVQYLAPPLYVVEFLSLFLPFFRVLGLFGPNMPLAYGLAANIFRTLLQQRRVAEETMVARAAEHDELLTLRELRHNRSSVVVNQGSINVNFG
jgi:hypothetical protein